MALIGIWDETLEPVVWFDDTADTIGWFDPDELPGTAAQYALPTGVTATAATATVTAPTILTGPVQFTNHIPDPSFEHDTVGSAPLSAAWGTAASGITGAYTSNAYAVSNTWSASGAKSLHIQGTHDATTSVEGVGAQTPVGAVTASPGIAYDTTVVFNVVQAAATGLRVKLTWLDASNATITTAISTPVHGGATGQFTVTFPAQVAPALTASVRVWPRAESNVSSEVAEFYIDSVSFGPTPTPAVYGDGDAIPWVWEGTAGNSPSDYVPVAGVNTTSAVATVTAPTNLTATAKAITAAANRAPVTIVQSATTAEGGFLAGTTWPCTLSGATTAGNTLIVAINMYGQGGGTDIPNDIGVSDGLNTFTKISAADVSRTGTSWGQHLAFYIAKDIEAQTSPVITASYNEKCWSWVSVWEVTPASFDTALTATGTNSPLTPGTLTPSGIGACLFAAGDFDGSNSLFTANNAGWTFNQNSTAGGGSDFTAAKPDASAATDTASFSTVGVGTNLWSISAISVMPETIPLVTAPSLLAPTASAATSSANFAVVPVSMSPTAAAVSAATELVTAKVSMTASAAGVSAAAGLVAIVQFIAPSAAGVSAASALVGVVAFLTPSAAGVSSAAAFVTATAVLNPSAAGVSAATELVTAKVLLTAAAAGVSAATAAVTAIQQLTATAAGVSAASNLVTAKVLITASAAGVSAAAELITAQVSMTASAAAVTAATELVTAIQQLTASASSVSAATELVTAAALLTAAATDTTSASGAVQAPGIVFFTPSAAGVSAATELVTAATLLTASASAASAATSFVTAQVSMTASAAGVSQATNNLTVRFLLTASAGATSAATELVTAAALLSPTASATTSAADLVTAKVLLTAAASAVSAALDSVSVPIPFTASAAGASAAASQVGVTQLLTATAAAISSALETLTAPTNLTATAAGTSVSTNSIKTATFFAPSASAATAASDSVRAAVQMQPTAAGVSAASSFIGIVIQIVPAAHGITASNVSGSVLASNFSAAASAITKANGFVALPRYIPGPVTVIEPLTRIVEGIFTSSAPDTEPLSSAPDTEPLTAGPEGAFTSTSIDAPATTTAVET